MRKITRVLILLFLILLLLPERQLEAQEGHLDGYLNNGGTFLDGTQGLIGCIGEPVIGLLYQDWQHCLQGFAYKTLAPKIVTPIHDLLNLEIHVNLFPNPVDQYLNIKYDGLITGVEKYFINDESGRLMLKGLLTSPITEVKVDYLGPGTYVFLLMNSTTNKRIYLNKFVKFK